jgi:hypothetical protein
MHIVMGRKKTTVRQTLYTASALFFVAWYYLIISNSAPFGFGDEGYLYYIGWILSEGLLPYKDFSLGSYPPGIFALFALPFNVFGAEIETGRMMLGSMLLFNVWLAGILAKELYPRWPAIIIPLCVALLPGPWHKAYITSLNLAALLLAIRIHNQKASRDYFFMGLVIGLGLQLRLDSAIIALILLMLTVPSTHFPQTFRKRLPFTLCGTTLSLIPLVIYFLYHGIFTDYLLQLFQFINLAMERSAAWYRMRPPTLESIFTSGIISFPFLYYFSLIFPLLLTLFLLKKRKKGVTNFEEYIPALLVLTWFLFNLPQYAIERPDSAHLYQRGFIFPVTMCFLLSPAGLPKFFRPSMVRSCQVLSLCFIAIYISYGLKIPAGGGIGFTLKKPVHVRLSSGKSFVTNATIRKAMLQLDRFHHLPYQLAVVPYGPGTNFLLEKRMPGKMLHFFPNAIRNAHEDQQAATEVGRANYLLLYPKVKLSKVWGADIACYAPQLTSTINTKFEKIWGNSYLLLLQRISKPKKPAEIIYECKEN